LQKQLWDSAENLDRKHWLETQGIVPLKQEFKPQVTLLSRKPTPTIAKRDPKNGNVDDAEDSEEEARKKREVDFEERQRRAKIEREEKQRKYAEARERILGSSNSTSTAPTSRESSHGRDSHRTSGKPNGSNKGSGPGTPAEQSPARVSSAQQFFDPNEMARRIPKREVNTPTQDAPTRQPRGPDKTGRGGFGFAAARGGKAPV